jgi:hypothetical protein
MKKRIVDLDMSMSMDNDAPRSKVGLASQRRLHAYIPANTEGQLYHTTRLHHEEICKILRRLTGRPASEDEPCEEKWIRRRRGSL